MQKRFNRIWLVPIFILLLIGIYYLPPIHSRLAWRIELARTQIQYWINPPDQAVFQPSQQNNPLTVENTWYWFLLLRMPEAYTDSVIFSLTGEVVST